MSLPFVVSQGLAAGQSKLAGGFDVQWKTGQISSCRSRFIHPFSSSRSSALFSLRKAGTFRHRGRLSWLSVLARNCVLFLFLNLAALAAYGQSPADEQKNTVRGTVINQLTQASIPRALVYSLDNRYAAMTDGEGRFEFTVPKANANTDMGSIGSIGVSYGPMPAYRNDELRLFARKPGFLDDPRDRRETRAVAGSDVTIALLPEGLIKGRVTLSTGDAATGVNVQLFSRMVVDGMPRWMPTAAARVNSVGEFRFAELRPGSYRLATRELSDNDPLTTLPGGQRYGFPPVYFPGVSDFSSASSIEVATGGTVQVDLSLNRQPYYDVKIPVVNNGDINGGVNISVKGQRGPGYSLGYSGGGSNRIEGMLPSGNYVVEASTSGENSVTGSVNLRVTGGPVNGPEMRMVRTSSITLEVKEEFSETSYPATASWSDGQHTYDIHGARAYLQARTESADDVEEMRGGGYIRQPTRPNDDSLVIENLQPGRYWLRLTSSRGYVASATSGGVDVLHEPITIAPASTIPVEVTMRDDGGKIDGTIPTISQSISPDAMMMPHSPQAWVYCIPRPNSPGQFETLGVMGDGKFHSRVMAPGDYLLLAFSERQTFLAYRDPEAMKVYESKGQVVHVSAGQNTSVQLDVIPSSE